MPYTIDSPDLPGNVQSLGDNLKAQWIEVFNSVLADCQESGGEDCEGEAMRQANGVLKTQQEEHMKLSEMLKALTEASGEMITVVGDLRAAIDALELGDSGAQVMAVMDELEAMLAPTSDEEEPEPETEAGEEPATEETPDPEPVAEAITESLTGSIQIVEAEPPASPRDPLAIKMRLIKAGPGNPKDKHYYPGDVLRRDAHVFEGVKMYTTDHDERDRSERTEVAKIREVVDFEEDGSPIGDVIIFDPAFAEKTRNRAKAGELDSLECSILAKGVATEGDVDGTTYNVVESIESAQAVDFVTRAGAGGKALSLAESEAGSEPEPDPTEPEGDPQKPLLEKERVLSILRETNLPKPSRERLADGEYADDAALGEAIAKETEYVKSVSGSGLPLGAGKTEPATVPATETAEEWRQRDAAWYKDLREKHGLSPR